MKPHAVVLAWVALLGGFPAGAGVVPDEPGAQAGQEAPQPVKPAAPAPDDPPPPPPKARPEPPAARPEAPPRDLPPGQWVYTDQYGWVWMPHEKRFIHVPPDGDAPDMYVYTQDLGWCWVVAPWVWGWGPMPYFGPLGPERFVWWGNGFGAWYGYRGRYGYRGWGGWGAYHGGYWHDRGGWSPGGGRSLSPPWGGGRMRGGWGRPR